MQYNFLQAQSRFPKAVAELCERLSVKYGGVEIRFKDEQIGWYGTDGVHAVGVWFPFNPNDLPEYFDGLGIYGAVNYHILDDGTTWGYSVDTIDLDFWDQDMLSRSAASIAMIDKLFEIREQQLKEN